MDATTKPTTGKMSPKPYRSECCKAKGTFSTNHWGDFYNTRCPICRRLATWNCQEPCPDTHQLPEPWKPATITIRRPTT